MIPPSNLQEIRTTAERKLASGIETMVMPTREVLGLVNALRVAVAGLEEARDGLATVADNLSECLEHGHLPYEIEVISAKAYLEDARQCLRDIGAGEEPT